MLKNYLKTSFRFLLKSRTFSFINIAGLAIGTLCCLYIVLYVNDQYQYDKHHKDADHIYRVTTTLGETAQNNMASSSPPIAPAMKKDFPEVLEFTRVVPMLGANEHLMKYKEQSFYENNALFVDSTFFDVFSYHFVNGKPEGVLSQPNSVVLMKPVADKLFGKEDPYGKVITIDDAYGTTNFRVTGVIDQDLGKSHLEANIFIRMNAGGLGGDILTNNTWTGNNFTWSYVKLQPNTSANLLEKKLPGFLNKYGARQLEDAGMKKALHLQPITSIHTTPGYDAERGKVVSKSFLKVLVLIAILIQIIACINFMNLATARASKRAKEVGVRKVVGAGKKSLILQFMSESFLLSLAGVFLALGLLVIGLPVLNKITDADINTGSLLNYKILVALIVIVVITGLFAGSYPAFYISSFKPVSVLKGIFSSNISSAASLRKLLVVFQFLLSVVLIGAIIVIYWQLEYIKNKDLGFKQDQQIVFSFHTNDTKARMPSIVNALRQLPGIKYIAVANNHPGSRAWNDWGVFLEGVDPSLAVDQQNLSCDENIMQVMGTRLLSGRNFRSGDSGSVIINEALMKKLGLNLQNAPGTKLFSGEGNYRIAGVMQDFNYRSLHESIHPFMFIYDPLRGDIRNIIISTDTRDYQSLLGKINEIWKDNLPGTPFVYTFLDDQVQKQYETEITMSRIIDSFTLVAIFISCLGLFGLAAFSAEQRKKEIGIRKVLGADIPGIVNLLSKDFIKLVFLAILIATPISWWIMNKWLQNFVYRIDISWWMFALAGCIAIIIAFATVSFQAIKAAMLSPSNSLRSE